MCGRKLRKFLSSLSLGKFHSTFYFKNRAYHSSVLGGMITIVLGIVVLCSVFVILKNTVSSKKMYLDKTELYNNYHVLFAGGSKPPYVFSNDSYVMPSIQNFPAQDFYEYLEGFDI